MRIDVSEPVLCDCDTCVQHRTLCNTPETEPSNVIIASSVPVSSGPVQALGSTSDQSSSPIISGTATPLAPPVPTSVNPEPAQSVDSSVFKFPPAVTPVSSEPAQALAPTASGSTQGPAFGFGAPAQAQGTTTTSATSTSSPVHSSSPATFQNPTAFTPVSASGPMGAPTFGSGPSTASISSTPSPFAAPSPLRWGSVQANGPSTFTPSGFLPAQGSDKTTSAFPPPFGYPGGFARPDVGVSPTAPSGYHFPSPLFPPGPGRGFGKTGVVCASNTTPKNPFGSYLHPGFGVVRHPSNLFGPNPQTTTPAYGGGSIFTGVETEQGSRYPRYAPTPDLDYSGGQGNMIISISASNSHRHKSHEELRWEDYKKGDKGGFGLLHAADASPFSSSALSPSFAYPSMPAHSHRTTVGPTQGNLTGFPIGYTIPIQRPHGPAGVSSPASGCTVCGATSSSSPSGHLGINGTTNLPSSVTSLPGLFFSTYGSCPLLFGIPNLAVYGTTTTPAVQAYAMIFGTTATPAVQAYPMMFGIPNLAAQGTTTTPAVQPYPTMFGTPNLGAQGTTTAPAVQPYPTMFETPNLAAQGTTTTPAAQPYPMMFGKPNLGAQAYPVHGLTLPFAAMSLQ